MTIITSPIAPDLVRSPPGPATLGVLIEAIRRLIARRKRRARIRTTLRRLLEADEALLRDIGLDRNEIRRQLRSWTGTAAPARRGE